MPKPAPRSLKVSAAYFRLLGYSQADAGAEVSRTWRTIHTWESEEAWPEYVAEAQELYLKQVIAVSRKSVLDQIKNGDGDLGFKILERNVKGFEPPTERVKLLMEQGEAEQIGEQVDHALGDMFARLGAHAQANGDATGRPE